MMLIDDVVKAAQAAGLEDVRITRLYDATQDADLVSLSSGRGDVMVSIDLPKATIDQAEDPMAQVWAPAIAALKERIRHRGRLPA